MVIYAVKARKALFEVLLVVEVVVCCGPKIEGLNPPGQTREVLEAGCVSRPEIVRQCTPHKYIINVVL